MSGLEGTRVLDFTRVLAGPLCTMILGDLGADVVKVERPGSGDETRGWGPPFVGEDAAYFLALNRHKRSVALDLGEAQGLEAARRPARRGLAVRRGRGRDGQPGREPPAGRRDPRPAGDGPSEHRPVPDVRDRRPPARAGGGPRPDVRADLRAARTPGAGTRRAVPDQRGPGETTRRAHPRARGGVPA